MNINDQLIEELENYIEDLSSHMLYPCYKIPAAYTLAKQFMGKCIINSLNEEIEVFVNDYLDTCSESDLSELADHLFIRDEPTKTNINPELLYCFEYNKSFFALCLVVKQTKDLLEKFEPKSSHEVNETILKEFFDAIDKDVNDTVEMDHMTCKAVSKFLESL